MLADFGAGQGWDSHRASELVSLVQVCMLMCNAYKGPGMHSDFAVCSLIIMSFSWAHEAFVMLLVQSAGVILALGGAFASLK